MNYDNNNEKVSQIISLLRFPLMAGVVVIHSSLVSVICRHLGRDLPVGMYAENLLSQSICGVCVPLFFFISGYLFFLKGEWCLENYKEKLRKRFFSLFIPYVVYTYVAILIFGMFQTLMPHLLSGAHTPIKDWSIVDYIYNGLWKYGEEGAPFVGPFWFLRNLMIIVVCSPLVYLIIKYLRIGGVIFLGFLYCINLWTYSIPGSLGVFFFAWGGYFSVFKKDFSKSLSSFSCISWLALPLFFVDAATKNVDWNVYLHPITVLLGVILSINLVTRLLSNRVIKPNKLLLSSTFFIYAIHEPYLDQVTKIIAPIIPIPDSEIMANAVVILFYLIYCIFDVFVLVAFYWLLYKMSPQFVGMLSGGRR